GPAPRTPPEWRWRSRWQPRAAAPAPASDPRPQPRPARPRLRLRKPELEAPARAAAAAAGSRSFRFLPRRLAAALFLCRALGRTLVDQADGLIERHRLGIAALGQGRMGRAVAGIG